MSLSIYASGQVLNNSTQVANLAANSLAGNGPAFSVYKNANQSISAGTWTKISFQLKEFDTANCFDATTNYRFTPTVSGYYQVSANVWMGGQALQRCSVFKNGAYWKVGAASSGGGYNYSTGISTLVYLNGSTDYIELYGYQNSGTQSIDASQVDTWFQGALVRAA